MLALFFLLAVPLRIDAYCYWPNGATILSKSVQACNKTTTLGSACCATNHSGAGDTGIADDVCESNGLCRNFDGYNGTNEGQPLWWRGGCTDSTWRSPYCLKDVCNATKYATGNVAVRNCKGNAWCCVDGPGNCCDNKSNIFQIAETVGPSPTSTPSPTTSLSPSPPTSGTSVTSPAAAATTRAERNESGGLGTGAKAGIGVGVVLLVILAFAVFFLVLFKKKKARKSYAGQIHELYDPDAPMGVHEQKLGSDIYAHNAAPTELAGTPRRAELPSEQARHELHAENSHEDSQGRA